MEPESAAPLLGNDYDREDSKTSDAAIKSGVSLEVRKE